MAGGGGEGRGYVVNKAVAAGLLGLQLLSLPFAVVSSSRHPRGVGLPDLQMMVSAAAQAKAPKTLTQEEEMIREFVVAAVHNGLSWERKIKIGCIMMMHHQKWAALCTAAVQKSALMFLFNRRIRAVTYPLTMLSSLFYPADDRTLWWRVDLRGLESAVDMNQPALKGCISDCRVLVLVEN